MLQWAVFMEHEKKMNTHSVEKSNRFLQHNRLLIIEPNTFEVEQPTHINFSTQRGFFFVVVQRAQQKKRGQNRETISRTIITVTTHLTF